MGENEQSSETRPAEGLPPAVGFNVLLGIVGLGIWGVLAFMSWLPSPKGFVEYATAVIALALNVIALYGALRLPAIFRWIVVELIKLGVLRGAPPISPSPPAPARRRREGAWWRPFFRSTDKGGRRPARGGASPESRASSGAPTSDPSPVIILAAVALFVVAGWAFLQKKPGPTEGPEGPPPPPAEYCMPGDKGDWTCALPPGTNDATTTLASDILKKPKGDRAVACLAARIWAANAKEFPGRSDREIPRGSDLIVSKGVIESEECPEVD
jgi:hypothetical protein